MWPVRWAVVFVASAIDYWPSYPPTHPNNISCILSQFFNFGVIQCTSLVIFGRFPVLAWYVYSFLFYNKGQACGGRLDMATNGVWESYRKSTIKMRIFSIPRLNWKLNYFDGKKWSLYLHFVNQKSKKLYLTSESPESLVPFSLPVGVRTILSWICKGGVQIQRETWEIRHCG